MKSIRILGIIGLLVFAPLHACSPTTPVAVQVPATASNSQPAKTSGGALPMFRGSPNHTGVYNSPPIRKLAGIKWKFKAGGYVTSSPALENGRIYFGSQDGNLYSLDSDSGAEIWRFHTKKPINSSPAVSNGLVYFQSNDGFTYALDAQSGREKWKTDTGPDRPTDYDFLSSSPAVQDNAVYIAGGNGNLYALDAASGQALWSVPASGRNPVRSSPAVAGGTVYFTAENQILALDTKTGRKKWAYTASSLTRSSPAVAEDVVIFGDNNSTIYALDSVSGAEKWRYHIKYYWVVSTAAISNDLAYVGGDDSYLNALDLHTGQVKWRFKTNGETVWSSPAVVGGVIYVGDWNFSYITDENGNTIWGYMHAVDAQTGEELWSYKTGGNIVSSPVVDGSGVLYFGSVDGYLYALYGHE